MNQDSIVNRPKILFFSPEKMLLNAISVFVLTTLFYFFGASLRLVNDLSLFWPLNAVLAAIFVRNPWLNKAVYYFICYAAMLVYDAFTTQWGWQSTIINFSNMVFIITAARLLLRYSRNMDESNWALNAFNIFNFSLIAAILSSLFGAVGSLGIHGDYHEKFMPLYADWVSEQFSTGVLMLPCLLTASLPSWRKFSGIIPSDLYPLFAVVIAVCTAIIIGGAGSLAFPLPALIWCAIRYPLPVTALLTLITGAVEIVLVAHAAINLHSDQPLLLVDQMFSARLGIATIAICPLIVSISVDAINQLIKQTSLRADYDYLTGVYSRSGLFEALKRRTRQQKQTASAQTLLCVMLLDIDFFKRINDSWGHECGDAVLASFAARVLETVGDRGMVARIGGEEFVVVCRTRDPRQGFDIAEQIRKTIELNRFHYDQQSLFITVSIGLAEATLGENTLEATFNKLIPEADKNLYLSKRQGRNKTSASTNATEAIATSHISDS
ncbi:GGDEF domain-containing protein [Cedecea sp.]|jgi:diguanylate cyclase (GGDEF)-like protein|uniref:GGDEF domain-containing protein n=1 Tax=Cedecea sp. TaxID=1970739 RepID=UPI0012AD5FF4|nr:diguanylate cyclase [Enterobacteriaceae bacterium RIT693]